ncbi:MAG: cytochrome c [Nitrospirota bacterium]|nr:cytochrome c [Nitrospirota bacterium]
MKTSTIITIGMTVILFFLCSLAFAQTLPEDPAIGGRLLASKGCVKCHSIKGEGGTTGPDLGRIDLGDTQLNLAARMWNHAPSMIAGMEKAGIVRPALTGQEFTEITAYLYFLRFFDEPGDPAAGAYIFEQKGCSACHPLAGRGKEGELGLDEFPRNVSAVFLSQAVWNHSLEMMARMLRLGKKWPGFADREMMDLFEFIRPRAKGPAEPFFFKPGNPREGKKLFAAKGCNKCHAIRGEGAEGGIDLGRQAKTFYTSLTQIASNMWNKAPEMILVRVAQTECGIPKFTAKEMSDLLAYLYFLHYIDEPGDTALGEKMFSEMHCAQCHSLKGERGKLIFIDLSGYQDTDQTTLVAGIWNHTAEMMEAMGVKNLAWPQLRKGDMADLLEFIRSAQKK